MSSPPIDYRPAFAFAALFSATLAAFAWQRRHVPGATIYVLLASIAGLWCAANFAETILPDPVKVPMLNLERLLMSLAPACWLVLSMEYAGVRGWLTRRRLALLAVLPLLDNFLAWTSGYHTLVRAGVYVQTVGALSFVKMIPGPLMLVNLVYSYACLGAAAWILVRTMVHTMPVYRAQAVALLIGLACPAIAALVDQSRFNDQVPLGLASLSFIPTELVVAWGLFRHRLFDVVPFANDKVLEQMRDAVIVLDARGCIAEMNAAAKQLLPAHIPSSGLVGQQADVAFRDWLEWGVCLRAPPGRHSEMQSGENGAARFYDVLVTELCDARGGHQGILAMAHDVSERKRNERDLADANARLRTQLLEIQALESRLREQSIRDPLTGLHNRRYLTESLEREIARAERDEVPLSIVMLDLDHFKKLNDSHGHAAGDLALQAVAAELVRGVRHMDVVCRYGGEEFLILMPGTSLAVAVERAEQLRRAMEALVVAAGDKQIGVTASVGVAVLQARDIHGDLLLCAADQALYAAKAAGRNCVRMSPSASSEEIQTV